MTDTRKIEGLLADLAGWKTRHVARTALVKIGPAAAEPAMRLAQNPDAAENARWAAITLLAEWKHAPAVPVLLAILKAEPHLRGEACRALQILTGREIGEDTAAWERFLNGDEARDDAAAAGGVADAKAAASAVRDDVDFSLIREAMQGVAQEVSWEAPGYAYIRCPCAGGRKQQVVACFQTDPRTGDPTVMVYTESGSATPAATDAISRRNATVRHGAAFCIEKKEGGEAVIACRCSIPRSQARPELLREIILHVAHEADALEEELHAADQM